jgi:hypothetical protein
MLRLLPLCLVACSICAFGEPNPPPSTPSYEIATVLKPMSRSISVSGTVDLPALTTIQTNLTFQLASQMKNLRMEVTSPASCAGPLHPAQRSDNGQGTGNFSAELKKAVPVGTRLQIKFSYKGGDKTCFVFHIGPDGSFGNGSNTAWYPEFGPVSEDGKFMVDGQANVVGAVSYTIPPDMEVVASGHASSPESIGRMKIVKYAVSNPSALAFALDRFTVVRSTGSIPVSLYTRTKLAGEGDYVAGIRKVVDQLSSMYGPFPFPEFSLVEVSNEAVRDAGFGGAGCAGFMLATNSFLNQGFNLAFFGHEIGHQWWGNEVTHTTEPEGEDLLDEAMAQYGSLYCVRKLDGAKAAKRYRQYGYPGYVRTQCGMQYLGMHLAGIDHPLGTLDPSLPLSHELADEKGFLVFDQLRQELGDETFHNGLKAVTKNYAFRAVTLKQFKGEIEHVAGRTLDWFWHQWLDQMGAPSLAVKWSQSGSDLSGSLIQIAEIYRFHVSLAIRTEDGKEQRIRMEVPGANTPFHVKVAGRVTAVAIDPDFELLHYAAELESEVKALLDPIRANWYFVAGQAMDAVAIVQKDLKQLPQPDRYGVEFVLRYYNAQILEFNKKYPEAIAEVQAALNCTTRREYMVPECNQLLMKLAVENGDLNLARQAARSAIQSEKTLGQSTAISMVAQEWLRQHG